MTTQGVFMNVKPFFKKYSISTTSVHLAIRDVGFIIDEARDPHITSNKLTVELGGHPSSNAIDAGIVARCMVERAFYAPDKFDAERAYQYALEKVKKISEKMPYLYSSIQNQEIDLSERTIQNNDKRQQAFAIFAEDTSLKNVAIARKLIERLGMTQSNASYYVSSFRKSVK